MIAYLVYKKNIYLYLIIGLFINNLINKIIKKSVPINNLTLRPSGNFPCSDVIPSSSHVSRSKIGMPSGQELQKEQIRIFF